MNPDIPETNTFIYLKIEMHSLHAHYEGTQTQSSLLGSAELAHEVVALRVCDLLVRLPGEGEVETLGAGDLVVLLPREIPREILRESPRHGDLLVLAARLTRLPTTPVRPHPIPAYLLARRGALEQLATLEVVCAGALRAVPLGAYPDDGG